MSVTSYENQKVVDLKKLCKDRGLSDSGKKADLVKRLTDSDDVLPAPAAAPATLKAVTPVPSPPGSPKAKSTVPVAPAVPLTDAEREKQRAERFGVPTAESEAEKLQARAERFGIVSEADKLKERAARFDLPDESLEAEKKAVREARFGAEVMDDAAKEKARVDRFGTGAAGTKSKLDMALDPAGDERGKRAKRAEKFGTQDDADKLKARADRFGTADDADKLEARAARFATA